MMKSLKLASWLAWIVVLALAWSVSAAEVEEETCDAGQANLKMPPKTRRALLTSNGLSHDAIRAEFVRLVRLRQPDLDKARVVYVPDAIVAEGTPFTKDLVDEFRRSLGPLGISEVSAIELASSSREEVEASLAQADVVYVECGNTFYLHYHMAQKGVKSILDPLLDGGLVYVGSSAGSIVAGMTAEIALWKGWDDPTVVPKLPDYAGLAVLGAKSFFPHYSSQYKGLVESKRSSVSHEVLTLTDSQCFASDEVSGERLVG